MRADVLERAESFIEYARSQGASIAGGSGAAGDAPKFLLREDDAGRWHADGAGPDARNVELTPLYDFAPMVLDPQGIARVWDDAGARLCVGQSAQGPSRANALLLAVRASCTELRHARSCEPSGSRS